MFYWSIGIAVALLVTWLSRAIIKFNQGGAKAHIGRVNSADLFKKQKKKLD